jgi:putative acetyltransferase
MPSDLTIHRERPDQPEAMALLAALDAYLMALYEPEANHLLDVNALLAPEVSFFVARVDGQAIGTGAVRRMGGEAATGDGPFGEIKRMYLDPAFRGQGYAALIIAALEAEVRANGLPLAMLETGRDQHEAIKLYERCGYARCAPFAGYPDNGLSLFMSKVM